VRAKWPGAGTRLRSLFLPGLLLIQHKRTRQESRTSCGSKSGLWMSVVIGRLKRDGDLRGRWTASKKGSDTVTPATTASTGKMPGWWIHRLKLKVGGDSIKFPAKAVPRDKFLKR